MSVRKRDSRGYESADVELSSNDSSTNADHPVITKRWNLTSLEGVIDEALKKLNAEIAFDFSKLEDVQRFRDLLLRLTDHILFQVGMDFERAAARGIQEAVRLIRDPDYYETVKKRRAQRERRGRDWQASEKAERRRRYFNPTPAERAADVRELHRSLEYHENCIAQTTGRLLQLEEPETVN